MSGSLPSAVLAQSTTPAPTLLVLPTGIGCDVGGFAGDAVPSARLMAAASGCLITHPNVMNGAALYWSDPRIHYVEGYALDRFAVGDWRLRPVRSQRIGLLLDAGIEPELRQRHLQVADGCRASLGLEIGPVVTTDDPLGVHLELGESGISWGTLERPDALLRAGDRLKAAGATAIAVVARFPEDPDSEALAAYRHGSGVDARRCGGGDQSLAVTCRFPVPTRRLWHRCLWIPSWIWAAGEELATPSGLRAGGPEPGTESLRDPLLVPKILGWTRRLGR